MRSRRRRRRHRLLLPRFRHRHFQTLPDASRPRRSYELSCGSSEPTRGAVPPGQRVKPCSPIRLRSQSQPPWRSLSRPHLRASTTASIVPLSACLRSIPRLWSPTPAPSSRRLRTRGRRRNAGRCFRADTRRLAPHTTQPSPTPASRSPTWPARTPATSRRAPPPCRIRPLRLATPAPFRSPWPTPTRTPRKKWLACRAGEEPRWTTRDARRSHPGEGTRVEAPRGREPRCQMPWTRKEPPR
mmetsp:Transcript_5428/g.20388  ORF Transcript_5428/g.20388 Transcript_5428/m.20388 type:complete len:242 (+) Transcript_5428:249-974(+)